MGQTITSIPHMISYAGDLRRQAKHVSVPELAAKLQSVASDLEKNALAKVGQTSPRIGALLDKLA